MEQNTKQMMLFKDISQKKVVADFNGGDVSSDGGLLFLREVDSRIQIIKRVVEVLNDKRHPGYVKHQLSHLLKQRVFQVASGYEDANDSDELRNDPIMKIVCERAESPLASQPTMSRFENSLSRTDLYRIAQVFVDVFLDSYKKAPKGIVLNIDDTDDSTHGSQHSKTESPVHDILLFRQERHAMDKIPSRIDKNKRNLSFRYCH